jgi:adenosyl cobinamide kinase/adenosyl cobinamide phosphate guanylyltransferase
VTLTVLVGGARSGKSSLALQLAARAGGPVVFLATGQALDDEMAARIDRHRAERPRDWRTVEEPVELGRALAEIAAETLAVVDCLSLWVSNVIESWQDEAIEAAAASAARVAAARPGPTIAVTNETGLGIVPMHPLARRYRDVLGRVNALWVEASDEAYFVVAGRRIRLEEAL